MSTVTAQRIIDDSAKVLNDVTGVHWDSSELLGYLNSGQVAIVKLVPSAHVFNGAVLLDAGKTKQSAPNDAIVLIDAVRNLGADGLTPGNAIRLIDKAALDEYSVSWHSDANTAGYIKHVTSVANDPKTFYVYPKAPATPWHIEVVYSVSPAAVTIGQVITLDDIYADALTDYILYRAFSKDSEHADSGKAGSHYQAFLISSGASKGAAQ
jgi:hypothetical protein